MKTCTMSRKIISFILASCMILSIMTAAVNADADTTPPSFQTGYPKEYSKETIGSKRLVLTTGQLSEPSFIYFVVVAKGAPAPAEVQIKEGNDASGKAALYSREVNEYLTTNAIYNFSFPLAEDDTEYDVFFLLEDAAGNQTLSSRLTVKTPGERTDPICEVVGGSTYTKIEDAISDVLTSERETVKLLDHVYHYIPVKLNVSKNIVFDLNNYYFGIDTVHLDGSAALEVSNGCKVSYIAGGGNGEFSVRGYEYGLKVTGSSSAEVTYAGAIGESGIAASAGDGCSIIVNGNVNTIGDYSRGVYARNNGSATINGNIYAAGTRAVGAHAEVEGAYIYVNGSISVSGDNSSGALAEGDGEIVVFSSDTAITMTGEYSNGINVNYGGTVTVTGDIEASDNDAVGVYVRAGQATVNGNIKVTGNWTFGADAADRGTVRINGNVDAVGEGAKGIYADMGEGSGGIAYVTGNVNVSSPSGDSIGVECYSRENNYGSTVTVDGQVFTDGIYIKIDDDIRTHDSNDTIEEGYRVYNGEYGSIVKIGNNEVVIPVYAPTVETNAVTDITTFSAILSGKVTDNGGDTVTERGFRFGTDSNLTTYTAISGTGSDGSFTADIEGLEENKTYYVRAYAKNSRGTGTGAIVSFVTSKTPEEPETPEKPPSSGGRKRTSAVLIAEVHVPEPGEIGWLDAAGIDLSNPWGNVVLYTDTEGVRHILGLGIIVGEKMKYVSRGPGKYEIIYNAKPFEDIIGHWAEKDIDFASARLLFNGVAPDIFSPDTPMTRGMFAAVLGRMYGDDPALYKDSSFEDVPRDAYYAPYVKWAAENKIIFGVSSTLFEPERAVTRQEMAAMMCRCMKYLGLKLTEDDSEFSDDALIAPWARGNAMQLKGTGIITGKPGNIFDPEGTSTRGETAAVLRRLIEYILR